MSLSSHYSSHYSLQKTFQNLCVPVQWAITHNLFIWESTSSPRNADVKSPICLSPCTVQVSLVQIFLVRKPALIVLFRLFISLVLWWKNYKVYLQSCKNNVFVRRGNPKRILSLESFAGRLGRIFSNDVYVGLAAPDRFFQVCRSRPTVLHFDFGSRQSLGFWVPALYASWVSALMVLSSIVLKAESEPNKSVKSAVQ